MEKDGFGRLTPALPRGDWRKLEVLLDRSWEKESITWNGLTWWDPLPCGRDFVVQVARYLQPSLPSPALSLLGNPPSPQMPKSSLESYPARLQTKNLCFVFPDGKLVPLQRLARVLPVCVLHVSRLRLPSIPIKFASIAKSARCSTYHGAHRDSFSP